jgi:hypothetical protein
VSRPSQGHPGLVDETAGDVIAHLPLRHGTYERSRGVYFRCEVCAAIIGLAEAVIDDCGRPLCAACRVPTQPLPEL